MAPNKKIKSKQSKYNPFNYWDKPLGKITIAVIGGTVVLFIGLAINHLLTQPKQNIPQIVAPNSVISVDQKGGITAKTVIKADTVNIGPQDRRITSEQLNVLLPALRMLSQAKIKISYATGNREQKQFAEDIMNGFQTAGIVFETKRSGTLITSYGLGLHFVVSSKPPHPAGGAEFQKALKKAKIDSKWHGDAGLPHDIIKIIVGGKP